ncbi:MAG: site-specific DNA-methyltransferase [Dysgonamonadaceae bacterium]|nr:site-specific DNA-methyltransferase [Dysgonamonadaceae bacterium]
MSGCPPVIINPFFGAGTTGLVAQQHGRNYIGIELNAAYVEIAKERLEKSKKAVL